MSASQDERTVHVRFSRVRSEGPESVSDFVERVFRTSDSIGAQRIVLDVGALQGGDAFLLTPLIRGVAAREQLQKHGAIVVIAGPESFSPQQNLVRLLQQYAHPIVVRSITI
jgi:spore germination protein YaaH